MLLGYNTFSAFIKDIAALGPVGDLVGGIANPIISMAALFFLRRTYQHQRRESDDNSKVTAKQIEELTKQSEAMSQQSEAMKKQSELSAVQVKFAEEQIEALHTQLVFESNRIETALLMSELDAQITIIKFYTSQITERRRTIGSSRNDPFASFEKIISMEGERITEEEAFKYIQNANKTRKEIMLKISHTNMSMQQITEDVILGRNK